MMAFILFEETTLNSLALTVLVILLILSLIYLFNPAIVAAKAQDSTRKIEPLVIRNSSRKPVLSLIIPAYDEEERLPKMLDEAFSYLSSPKCKALKDLMLSCRTSASTEDVVCVEWIVVSDGSKDRTDRVYEDFVSDLPNSKNQTEMIWKLISFPRNAGKGAAVQAGMLAAQGNFCLMVDADGATEFEPGLEALTEKVLESKKAEMPTPIFLGSRAHLQNQDSGSSMGRKFIRSFLTEAFHFFAVVFVGAADIRDTQCGFKLLPRSAAHHIFDIMHLRRWAFDTELVYLANHLDYSLREVGVPWHEVEGSKLHTSAINLALVSIGMLRDMVCVRLCYILGLWKIRKKRQ